ncbi:MAG TPA: hypothetical protein VFI34_04775 [Candidatus Limnocylindrales bacterium]|nr:hypothetical protein [Candidatus Limnocylindrales bacterium]
MLVLPLLAFFLLAGLFALVLRRAGRFLAATRDVERFRRQVDDLSRRAETSLAEVSARVDAVRRGQLGADQIGDDIAASIEGVGRYADEARAFHPPTDGHRIRDEIVAELERAGRALEMVEHGRVIQTSARAGAREIEAQTAIKRGYLNVLHAREAISHQAKAAADLSAADAANRFQQRRA